LPRGLASHGGVQGAAWRRVLGGLLDRLGLARCPAPLKDLVATWGRLALDLEAVELELAEARQAGDRKAASELRGQALALRSQAMGLETRIATAAEREPASPQAAPVDPEDRWAPAYGRGK
jgi:hypothetical protein